MSKKRNVHCIVFDGHTPDASPINTGTSLAGPIRWAGVLEEPLWLGIKTLSSPGQRWEGGDNPS